MPLYREDNYLVVHPGSQSTIFSFGLQDSLSPPQYKIPSKVYYNEVTKEFRSKKEESTTSDDLSAAQWEEIYPIVQGKIVHLDAFNYLLKIILQSVITKNPIITINQIPLLIISSCLTWLRATTEYVTKYVLESLEFPAFNVIDLLLAANFGLGVSLLSCVVNIGQDNVQIMPVINYQSIKFAGKYLPGIGGQLINNELKKNLPSLSDEQIEELKKSGIYEVVINDNSSFYSMADLKSSRGGKDDEAEEEDDDDFDVAKLVTELDNGKIVLDEKKKETEDEEDLKPNTELEKNFFIDPTTQEKVYIGKERFQGTEKLIALIADAIYRSLSKIPNLEKRQECFDNLIFVGSTFKIPGFKKALLIHLATEYLVRAPVEHNTKNGGVSNVNSAILAYQQTGDVAGDSEESTYASLQVPTSIKTVKLPEYFPEWKKPKEKGGSWEDVYFLGGEIYAKQIFGGNSNQNGEMFIDHDIYEEKGPQGIWDVSI